jgi:SAM-dependent methyltransferase
MRLIRPCDRWEVGSEDNFRVDHPPIGSGQAQPGDARMRLEIEKSAERPYYHEFAWAYDLVAPRMDFVQGVLSNQGIGTNSTILDAGCGTGRYTIDLATRGYQVFGVDRSPELIAVAQKRAAHAAVPPKFMTANLHVVTFTRLLDAILCRGVRNDLVEESDRIAIFQQFRGLVETRWNRNIRRA